METDQHDNDEPDPIPLHHKRPFGSGLKRKEVQFVPASSQSKDRAGADAVPQRSKAVSDLYLNLVLPGESKGNTSQRDSESTHGANMCAVCNLPVSEIFDPLGLDGPPLSKHEATIAHQVCMPHSHPPSALDRSRMGLSVLQSQGWDPDSRKGLGIQGQGMQYPLKTEPKRDNLGVGARVPKEFITKKKEKDQTLDAKKCRKMAAEDKKRTEKLRQQFYASSDLERYLGGS